MAIMGKRDICNRVLNYLASNLENVGFKFIKKKERILRYHHLGFDVIIFNVVDYNSVFEVDFSLRTRIDDVENIVNQFMLDCMNPKFMALTETVAISFQELSNSTNEVIKVTNEAQLEQASLDILLLIQEKGMRFYEQNRDLKKLNEFLKIQILEKHGGIGLHHDRRTLMQSLTAMRLCDDPEFLRLEDKYKELYVPFAGEEEIGRKAIDDLIRFLKALRPK